MRERPTLLEIKRYLSYDPVLGIFTWIASPGGRAKIGKRAGTPDGGRGCSYRSITIFGFKFYEHHLAWLIMTGDFAHDQIDHRNRNGHDNRWNNLRIATHAQNLQNRPMQKNNTSGIKGVSKRSDCNRWVAHIGVNGEALSLGIFKTLEDAVNARKKAAAKYHGEFASE